MILAVRLYIVFYGEGEASFILELIFFSRQLQFFSIKVLLQNFLKKMERVMTEKVIK